jgi:tetratricopeptide (TPR) repeat protein
MPSLIEKDFDVVRQFVAAARLEEAVDYLSQIQEYQNEAARFAFRLKDVESQDVKGLLTYEQARVERTKIADDILAMITVSESTLDSTEEAFQHLSPLQPQASNQPPFILTQPDISSFTGRLAELQQLETLIFGNDEVPPVGIAVLTGTGGMGKSVLASHFATIHKKSFPDGVIGLRLHDHAPESVAQTFTSLSGTTLPPDHNLSAAEIMQSVFQQKQSLLIFDNAEDATAKFLLPGGSLCKVLVTTRNKGLLKNLDIPAASYIDLTRFSATETRDLLGKIITSQRVEAEPDAVAEIHELVGGLPLAIRIIGGALDEQLFTTLTEYAQLLGDEKARLSHLRSPDDPDLNVEASFGLSLERLESLNETETIKVFACLGACSPDGFSLLAAQVASGQSEFGIKSALGRLMRLSLVIQGNRIDQFTLHPLLFLFARQKAEAYGWLAEAEQRHTDFFLDFVQEKSEPSPDNFEALKAELNSLLLAGRRLAAKQQPRYDFYVALEPFLEANGYWKEALDLIERFSGAARATGNITGMAHFSLQRGQFFQLCGNFEEARASYLESERFVAQIENSHQRQHIEAMVLNSLGGVYQRQGNFDEAVSAFEQSWKIKEAQGDEHGLGMVLNSLGGVYQRQGKFDKAVSAFEQSKEISERLNDERSLAMVLNSLGGVYQRQGNFSGAITAFEQSKEITERQGNERGLAMVLNSLGGVYQRQGNFSGAITAFEQSKEIAERQGNERGLAMVLNSLGGVYQRQGKFDKAVSAFEQSKEILERLDDERGLAMVLNSLGGVYQRLEMYGEAVEALKRSAELEHKFGNLRGQAMVLTSLSGAYRKQTSPEAWSEAVLALKQSENIEEKMGNRRGQAMVLTSLGDVYQRLREFGQAIAVLQKSYELEVLLNNIRGQAMVLTSLGKVHQQEGDLEKAVEAFSQALAIEEQLGNGRGEAMVLCAWGKALLSYRKPQPAAEKLKRSFEIDESLRNVKGLRVVTSSLVRALTILRQREVAHDYIARALAVAPEDRKLLTLQRQLGERHPVSSQTIVKNGTIKKLLHKPTGYLYGFITPDDAQEDIYFGEESINRTLLPELTEGAKVKVNVELSARGHRARNVWSENNLPDNSCL